MIEKTEQTLRNLHSLLKHSHQWYPRREEENGQCRKKKLFEEIKAKNPPNF